MSIPEVWTKSPAMYQKLQELLKGGKFYEALQVYMTQINRSGNVAVREASKIPAATTGVMFSGEFVPCYTIAPSGAKCLGLIEDAVKMMFVAPTVIPSNIDAAYVSSRIYAAEELITLYITNLEKICPYVMDEYLQALYTMVDELSVLARDLSSALGVEVDITVLNNTAYSLVRQSIKHSMSFPIAVAMTEHATAVEDSFVPQYYRHGYAKLQQLAANIKGDDASAESIFHWTRANNATEHLEVCLQFLRDSNEDLYADVCTQIVLEYLSIENVAGARVFYNGISTRPIMGTMEKQVLEFIKLALLAAKKDAKDIYKTLLQNYRRVLNSRDEKYRLMELAQEVGNVFFDLPPPTSMMEQVMSMAQGMMGMFGGGGGMGAMLQGM